MHYVSDVAAVNGWEAVEQGSKVESVVASKTYSKCNFIQF